MVKWTDLLLTYLADKLGDEAVHETSQMFYERFIRPVREVAAVNMTPEERVRMRARGWAVGHCMTKNFEIEEDDQKFTFKIPCNTGCVLRATGRFGKTKGAYPWTRGESGFPLYCSMTATGELDTVKQLGAPLWIGAPQKSSDEGCVLYIVKDPKHIPEEYYRKLGLKKPKSK